MMSCLRPSPKANILLGTSGGSSFTKRFGMPMAARADFSEKYLTPESGLPKAHNLSSVLAFSNGQSPGGGGHPPPPATPSYVRVRMTGRRYWEPAPNNPSGHNGL